MVSSKGVLILHFLLLLACTLVAQTGGPKYDIVVAADGSGKFKTIQEAINATPDNQSKRTVIFVKRGIYKEKVVYYGIDLWQSGWLCSL